VETWADILCATVKIPGPICTGYEFIFLFFALQLLIMHSSSCLNCNNSLQPADKFCSYCGQNASVHRFTLRNFFHEGFHAVTHTDKGIFHLLKCLATKPGTTAREYIMGKRKKYFNPFTFFLIMMGVFVFSNNYFSAPLKKVEPDPRIMQRMPPEAKQKYTATMQRVNTANTVFRKNGNVVAMIAVPFITLFTWLFFRRRGFNYGEHLTANMMFVAFSNLIFTILIFPLHTIFKSGSMMFVIAIIGMLLQALYFTWSMNGFLQLKTASHRFKSFAVSFTCILLWALFSMTAMAIYIYQSRDFYKFFTRMSG
jgi:Protein of unknown function (DUF3667)